MANWPIIRSQRTMPGTSTGVRANLDFDTGEGEVWRQIGNLAAAGTDVVSKFYAQQAESQLMDSKILAEEEIMRFSRSLNENQDESTYQGELDKSISAMNKFRPKNKMAAKGYDSWIKNQIPDWRESTTEAERLRLNNKWLDTRDTLAAKAIETGTFSRLRVHMKVGVSLGRTDGAAAGNFIRDTVHKAELWSVGTFASTNPESLLQSSKDGKIEGYVTLSPTDVQTAEGMARRIIHNRDLKLEDTQEKVGREMLVSFWNGGLTNPQDVTDALERNHISTPMAKYLRDAILNPKNYTAQEILIAETQVRNAIDRYQSADITDTTTLKRLRQDAIESLYMNADILGETKGSVLLAKIYDEVPDKALADMTREGKGLMVEYIRTRDPISGMFKDNKQEIMLTAEAQLLLDIEIEKAGKVGKPLGRRDIMIKAMEIGKSQRNKLDKMEKAEVPKVPYELGMKQKRPEGFANIGQAATFPDGTIYGVFVENPDDELNPAVELNEVGARWILSRAGGDVAKARRIAKEEDYIIPE